MIRLTLLILLGAMGIIWHLLASPKEFQRDAWIEEIQLEKTNLALKIQGTILRSARRLEASPDEKDTTATSKIDLPLLELPLLELQLANDIRHTKGRLLVLISDAERQLWISQSGDLTIEKLPDMELLQESRDLIHLLSLAEKIHRLRASLLDADRRSHAALHAVQSHDGDDLSKFWDQELPWLETELRRIRDTERTRAFARSLNVDIERLAQTALDIELHRIDVWMDWAASQPSSRLSELKTQASHQMMRLESLSLNLNLRAKSARAELDPRLKTLQKNLRRMASVSNLDNW